MDFILSESKCSLFCCFLKVHATVFSFFFFFFNYKGKGKEMYLGKKESLHSMEPIFIILLLARSFPCPHSHPSLPTAHSMDKVLHLQQTFSLLSCVLTDPLVKAPVPVPHILTLSLLHKEGLSCHGYSIFLSSL